MLPSFRAYVNSVGDVMLSGGAERTADGRYAFPAAAVETSPADPVRIVGSGTVAFQAHGGLLSFTLGAPWIEADDHGIWLSVSSPGWGRRVHVADLTRLPPAPDDFRAVFAATLAVDGVRLFGEVYPLGLPLENLVIEVDGDESS
jgi:hypothetical protein